MLSQNERAEPRPNNVRDPEGEARDAYLWLNDTDALDDELAAKGVKFVRDHCDQHNNIREFEVRTQMATVCASRTRYPSSSSGPDSGEMTVPRRQTVHPVLMCRAVEAEIRFSRSLGFCPTWRDDPEVSALRRRRPRGGWAPPQVA